MKFFYILFTVVITFMFTVPVTAQHPGPEGEDTSPFDIIDPVETVKSIGNKIKDIFSSGKKEFPPNLTPNTENFERTKQKTYKVKGKTISKVKKNIKKRFNQEHLHAGHTEWNYNYKILYDENGKAKNVRSFVETTTVLPRWTKVSEQCASAQAEWKRFLRELNKHERGHVAHIKDYFLRNSFTRSLLGKTRDEVKHKIKKMKADIERDSKAYHKRVGKEIGLNDINCGTPGGGGGSRVLNENPVRGSAVREK